MKRFGQTALTASEQFFGLRNSAICFGEGALRAGRLTWWFRSRPTPLSREYGLRVEFRQGDVPDVFVEDPDLKALAGGKRLPHVYRQERPQQLCLYKPKYREWRPELLIHESIVPWAVAWLYYFEDWLMTGEWAGGGEHPI
jgi:hypothetical protein